MSTDAVDKMVYREARDENNYVFIPTEELNGWMNATVSVNVPSHNLHDDEFSLP